MESDARYTWVGLSMAALFLLLAASIYWLTGVGSRPAAKRYVVVFQYQSLDGVQIGTEVRMRGIKVGRVVDYGIPSGSTGAVRVVLEVDKRVPVLEGASAAVNRNLLTGLARVSITNVSEQAPPLMRISPGEDYPTIVEGTTDIDRVTGLLEDLGATGQQTLQRVNVLLSDRNQKAITKTLENTHVLAGRLAETVPDLRATLQETRLAAARIDSLGRDAESTLAHADRKIDALSAHVDALSANAMQTLDTTRTTLTRAQDQFSRLGMQLQLTTDLAGQEIHSTADALRQAARDVQRPARALAEPEKLLFGPAEAALGPGEK